MTLTVKTTGIEQYLEGGDGRLRMLILGAPSSGKTRSASAYPRPIFVDCEDGLMSVADRRVPFAAIRSTDDMKQMLALLGQEAKRPKAQRRWDTVVIDTIDSYQRIVIQEYLKSQKKAAMSGWQDWGHLDAEMNALMAALFLLPFNVIVNCHVKETRIGDDDNSMMVKVPKLKGDLREQIAGEFDFVGLMETGFEAVDGRRQVTRYIQWEPTPQCDFLKARSGSLPPKTPVDFTSRDYESIRDALAQGVEGLTDGEVVESLESAPPAEPVPAQKGGPVGDGTGAKSAPAKKAAAKPKQAAPSHVPPAPAAAPPPVAKKPVTPAPAEPPVTPEQGVKNMQEVLGATPIEQEGQAGEQVGEQEGQAATPVAEPATPPEPEQPQPAQQPEQQFHDPDEPISDGVVAVACGQVRYPGETPKAEGCGQELVLDIQQGRVTGVRQPEGENADLIEIGGLKGRAFLCNACFARTRVKK